MFSPRIEPLPEAGYRRGRLLSALLLLTLLTLVGCKSGSADVQFISRGKDLIAKKEYARAILEFKNAASFQPKNAEPYYQSGLAYLAMGDFPSAYRSFRQATELDPKHAGAQIKLAEMLSMNDDKDRRKEAEDRAKGVLERSPGNPEALTVLGVTQIASGDKKAGEEELRAALESAPTHLPSAVLLAKVRLKDKDFAGAEKVLKSVAEKDPNSADAALALGQLYGSARRWDEAVREYERAVRLQPSRGVALLLLAQTQIAAGQAITGEQTLRRLSALPDKQYRTAYATYLLESKQWDAAVSELRDLYRKDSKDRTTRTLLIRVYTAMNRQEEAEKLIESTLKANPKDTEALLQRSQILLNRGNYMQAKNDLTDILRVEPNSSDAHWMMANLYKRNGSTLQARRELVETIGLNPNLIEARLELVESELNTGGASNAMVWIDKTPENQRRSPPVVAKRIKVLLALRRYGDARTSINEALKASRSRDLLMLDAQLRLEQKDFSGARASAEEVLKGAPEDVPALDLVAATYSNEKHPDMALRRIRDQVALRPKSAGLQYRLAVQLLANHDYGGASRGFTETLRLDPAFVPAALELAKLDIREGRNDEARRRLTALLSSNGAEMSVRLLLAHVELNVSNTKAAIEQYRLVLNTDSNNLIALNNLASLLADDPDGVDEALKYAQQLKELAPNDSLVDDTLGWAYYRKGLYPTAMQYLKTAVEKQQNPVIKYHLAMTYFKVGDRSVALRTLAAALKENPNLPEAEAAQKLIGLR